MVWSDLIIDNATELCVRKQWFRNPMSGCVDLSGAQMIWEMDRKILTLKPEKGFLGIECGVGGTYKFVMIQEDMEVGEFTVEIGVPSAGDNTFEMSWQHQPPGVTAVLTHRGKGGTCNAHVHHLMLNIAGHERMRFNTPDVTFRSLTFQRIPSFRGHHTRRRLEFPGRINKSQKFTLLSFPGIYEPEWVKITHMEMIVPEQQQLSVACVFFPEGSALDGKHMRPCNCEHLYRDTHPEFYDWPGGQAPWGCKWFEKWMKKVEEMAQRGHTGVVVYKRGLTGEEHGLGNSQRGEVRHLQERGIPYIEVDIDEFMHEVVGLARERAPLSQFSPPQIQYRCTLHEDHDTCGGRDAECHRFESLEVSMAHAKAKNYSGFAYRDGHVWYKKWECTPMELLSGMGPSRGCNVAIMLT